MVTISKRNQTVIPFYNRFQIRVAFCYFLLIIAVLIILNVYPPIVSRNQIFTAKQSTLSAQGVSVSAALDSLSSPTADSVVQVMSVLDISDYTQIAVVNAGSELLFIQGETDPEPALLNQGLRDALDGYDYFYSVYDGGIFTSIVVIPFLTHDSVGGAVYLYDVDSESGAIIHSLQFLLQTVSGIVLVVMIAISFILYRTFSRRQKLILSAIDSVRQGDYSHRIEVAGKDELAQLGIAFNDLTERLERTDEVRRRFVSDASHELKTPLASIRLLSDSILQNSMDMETATEFVRDISNESERLARITEKLLSLTRFDNNVTKVTGKVDVCEVAHATLRTLRPLAAQRNIDLRSDLSEGCFIKANEDDVSQVLLNLAENAVKYNVDNGFVKISVSHDREYVRINVEDCGIGVPKDSLPNIFDRFYRVDKARSRATGGSGLGLSIVRAAVREHNGIIEASRRAGGGMIFAVTFPLYTDPKPSETDTPV